MAHRRLATKEDAVAGIRRWAGADRVNASFETSGSGATQNGAVEVTGPNGKIAFVGSGDTPPALTPAHFIQKQLTLCGSFVFDRPLRGDAWPRAKT